ncbi:MAG: hypothetical protein ACFE95_02760 [Candidatus Hodarchaeota archaeon]
MAVSDLFSEPLSVRLLNELVQAQTENSKILMDDNRVIWAIYLASAEVRAGLYRTYPGDDNLQTTPITLPPLIPKENEHSGVTENTGSGALSTIQVNDEDNAKTELWTITFSSTTAFSVVGSRSGSQGSGDTDADFTSTNAWIKILSASWSGTPANGDIFYAVVWSEYPMVVYLTTLIAASIIHNGLFNFLAPNETVVTDRFRQEANRLIKALNNGYDFQGRPFRLPSFSVDSRNEIPNPYYISRMGLDLSNYSDTEEPSIITSDVDTTDVPFWWR